MKLDHQIKMPKKSSNSAQSSNAPVKTFRFGTLKAAIWANQQGDKVFYSTTFCRSYQDAVNQWHDTDSYNRDDLLALGRLAEKAHDWIFETLAAGKAE